LLIFSFLIQFIFVAKIGFVLNISGLTLADEYIPTPLDQIILNMVGLKGKIRLKEPAR